jgi:NAD(P)-dependent dehydrogenase (short-subunit alcohol dehydrogenase family)
VPSNSVQRTWIVTGGSRGFGRAVAARAACHGDRVAILARGDEVGDVARALGGDTMGLVADVADPASIDAAVREVTACWGGIDVVVNNAGLHRGGLVDQVSMADWQAVLATNLSGPLQVVRAALPHMGEGGAIVNVGAVVGFRGFPGDAAYGASKAGLSGLTQVMAAELARRGIRANLVIPGFVMTEMTQAISPRARERLVARIPLGREGRAEEIAEVIWWVAGSTYMTGAVIPTDGGLMCAL